SLVAIQAIRGQDAKLFESLLLTADELKELGLPAAQSDKIRARIQLAQREFSKWSQDQQAVEKDSRWLHFGGGQPALLPQGPGGGKRDIVVYDNTAAVVETGGEHTQIQIGSLVQIGSTWRLLGLPKVLSESDLASAGLFFGQSYQTTAGGQTSSGGFSQQMQDLLAKLEEVDKELLATSSAAAQARLQGQRADLMEKLAGASGNPEDKKTWLRQLADTMSAAVQNGDYAGGVERLTKLVATVEQLDDTSLTAYVEFRLELSKYSIQLSKSNADFSKVQDRWLKALEGFVKKYPQAIDSAEAMLQLGLAREFTGESSAAIGWYDQIVKSFADTEHGKKAAGAKTRLQSVGKTIRLAAATLDNKKVDLSAYRGRPVVVHYWSTLSGTGAKDEATLKNLQAKYGRKLGILGVNLDTSRQAAVNHVKQARISWPQLFEEGGRDSRLANEMGILTLPTTFLIDDQGRLISHSIHTGELDGELKKLIR
ncbi:MAG: redoxin family protein, partial [Pirellulaceae bacterium]|nr:redoxin family protein [Pirellulaceae bacterium]